VTVTCWSRCETRRIQLLTVLFLRSTSHRTVAEIKSDFGGAWSNMIRQRIESYGVGKFEVNSDSVSKLCRRVTRALLNVIA
jgi:hypothetical protein